MRRREAMAISLCALALCSLLAALSGASFTDTAQNPQTVSAAADFLPPTAEASTIAKSQGGAAGYIKASGTYYVYAKVADSGNPASGIAAVTADVSSITTNQTSVSLAVGSYEAGGISYNYRSEQLTAKSSLTTGSKAYTLTLSDAAKNSGTQSFSVTVNGPFKGSDFETDNVAGGTEGKPEKGDTVTFAFNNPPEPGTIVPGWTGSAATTVTVAIEDTAGEDTLKVNSSGSSVLGSVNLKGDYVNSGKTASFGVSTMTLSGSTLTIVLGSEPAGNAATTTAKSKPSWAPPASIFDQAWNACSTSSVIGANKKQF